MNEEEFKDKNVEIYYKIFPVGSISEKLHLHPLGKDYIIVISGRVKYRIDNDIIVLEKGDYIAVPNNTIEQIVEVLEELTIIGVRYPSASDNKVVIKQFLISVIARSQEFMGGVVSVLPQGAC